MAPTIIGGSGDEEGDKQVFRLLEMALPEIAIVYAQPRLVSGEKIRKPDYVIIHPQWGIVVLEVKDWIEILEADRNQAVVRKRNGQQVRDDSPVSQAQTAGELLQRMLQKEPALLNDNDKLYFRYAYAGIMPFISKVQWLEERWGKGRVFGRDDLKPNRIIQKIEMIPDVGLRLIEAEDIPLIRSIIDPSIAVKNPHTGEAKGYMISSKKLLLKSL